MACAHETFDAEVDVNRITDGDNGRPDEIRAFVADVRIACRDCGERFIFQGVAIGLSPRRPTASVDGCELHLPLRPESAPISFGDFPGFAVAVQRAENRDN